MLHRPALLHPPALVADAGGVSALSLMQFSSMTPFVTSVR